MIIFKVVQLRNNTYFAHIRTWENFVNETRASYLF